MGGGTFPLGSTLGRAGASGLAGATGRTGTTGAIGAQPTTRTPSAGNDSTNITGAAAGNPFLNVTDSQVEVNIEDAQTGQQQLLRQILSAADGGKTIFSSVRENLARWDAGFSSIKNLRVNGVDQAATTTGGSIIGNDAQTYAQQANGGAQSAADPLRKLSSLIQGIQTLLRNIAPLSRGGAGANQALQSLRSASGLPNLTAADVQRVTRNLASIQAESATITNLSQQIQQKFTQSDQRGTQVGQALGQNITTLGQSGGSGGGAGGGGGAGAGGGGAP